MSGRLRPARRRVARRALAALALTTGLLAAAGCEDTGEEGAVSVMLFGDPEELAAYRGLIEDFERGTRTEVELVEASDREDLIARLSTSIAGGSPPDVFLLSYRYYGQFAASDAIAPLDERIAGSELVALEDLYPVATEAFRWQGEQLCLPQNVSSLAVYYNRDLFRTYGVEEPPERWTWNQMIQAAVALTRDASGNRVVGTESDAGSQVAVYGLGVEASMIRLAPLVWSNGGELTDDPDRPTRFTLDTPEAREALRAFLDLRLAYGVIPTDAELESLDDESRFANGGLAMLLSSRRATTTFRSIEDFEWDVAPLPVHDEQVGILHSDAFCISAASPRQGAAWEFVEYAVSAEGQRALVGTGRTVPSQIEVAESADFLGQGLPPSRSRVFLDAVPRIRATPVISTWPEIEDVTGPILEDALYRGLAVDEVVRRIDEETREIFARAEAP